MTSMHLPVYESGGAQGYVYFPTTAIVSLLYVLEDGLLRFTHRQLCRSLLLSLDRLPTHKLQSRQDHRARP
jgi:hypothetical protein